MKIKPSSFKLKLISSYLIIILVTFGFIGFFLNKSFEENSLQELKTSLYNQASLIENQIPAKDLRDGNLTNLNQLAKALSQRIKTRITIINNNGRVLADSEKSLNEVLKMENHSGRTEIKSALAGGIGEEIHYSSTLKIDMLYVAIPVKEKKEVIGAMRLALPIAKVQKIFSPIRKTILASLIFALGLAFVLGSILSAGIIKPVNRMIYFSKKVSRGDFSHRIFYESSDEIGELVSVLNKMAKDIEDKIKQVEVQNQQLKAIFSSMIEGIIVTDKDNRIISLNPRIEDIFGIIQKDAEGKDFLEVIPNNDISEILVSVLKKGEFISRELSLIWPVNKTFQINASPIFEKGNIKACLLVVHDITEIRRLERVRSDFVANVSHELKTPLTSIKGFVETLLEGALHDKENNRHFLEIIQEHTNRLDNLINDLLSLSYLESPQAKLQSESFKLRDLTEKILLGFKSQLNKKSIKVENKLPDQLLIKADTQKIEQVLTNLLDNAIKFNKDHGSIKIYCQDSAGLVKILVEDSGTGIPPKDISRIFERFYRVDKARSRELKGTGLGLAIVKHIIDLHGGSVGVDSDEGLGSKFWFILPK